MNKKSRWFTSGADRKERKNTGFAKAVAYKLTVEQLRRISANRFGCRQIKLSRLAISKRFGTNERKKSFRKWKKLARLVYCCLCAALLRVGIERDRLGREQPTLARLNGWLAINHVTSDNQRPQHVRDKTLAFTIQSAKHFPCQTLFPLIFVHFFRPFFRSRMPLFILDLFFSRGMQTIIIS